jgi:hypothetical protein
MFAGSGAAMMKNGGNTEKYEIGDRLVDGGRLTFVPGKSRKIQHVSRIKLFNIFGTMRLLILITMKIRF